MNICQQCGIEFEPARSDQKFHNNACKQANKRGKMKEEATDVAIVTEVAPSKPIEPVATHKGASMTAEEKSKDRWGDVCTLEEWKQYPKMCENKAQAKALIFLYDSFTAEQLANAGILPPKWKQFHATYAESKESLDGLMKGIGMEKDDRGIWVTKPRNIDYSTWK